jgi:hypothetical protein
VLPEIVVPHLIRFATHKQRRAGNETKRLEFQPPPKIGRIPRIVGSHKPGEGSLKKMNFEKKLERSQRCPDVRLRHNNPEWNFDILAAIG